MVCTIDEFYCIRQTAPAVIIKVTENQLLATSPQICRDGMNFIAGKTTCTDPQITATISGQMSSTVSGTLRPDVDTLTAINGFTWIMFSSFLIIILLLSVQMGLSFFKKV
jgi:hypothetical protein